MSSHRTPSKRPHVITPVGVYGQHLSRDPVLRPLVESYTVPPLERRRDVFGELVRAIVHQQLSSVVAERIYDRLCDQFDGQVCASVVAGASFRQLRAVGMSATKARAIIAIAAEFVDSRLGDADFDALGDDQLLARLCRFKGVGAWTANMVAMFSLQREDIFPLADFGLRMSMRALYDLGCLSAAQMREQMLTIAQQWRPYRTYASLYLWHYYADKRVSQPDLFT